RRQVRFAPHILSRLARHQVESVGKVNRGDLDRYRGQGDAETLDGRGRLLANRVNHAGEHLCQYRHHCGVILDETELDVERDVFVQVAGRVVRLRPEDRSNLEDPLEDTHHDLLVELRALRQISRAAKVIHGEYVCAPLGRG